MKALLFAMNILAFLVSFGAILWAWFIVRKDMQRNEALLVRLNEIELAYSNEPAGLAGGDDRRIEKNAAMRAAGKTMFTYGDLANMPEIVKQLIYSHAITGLALQVWLVGAGMALGTAANILSLYVQTGG